MDLSTIHSKLLRYRSLDDFAADVKLMFDNARTYNSPETEYHKV
jgi:hypothetical protein